LGERFRLYFVKVELAVIAIVAVAGVATYIAQQQKQDKGAEKVRQVEEKKQGAILPEKPKIDTSDWKVYRKEKYGFEVRYPPTWKFSDGSEHVVSFQNPNDYKQGLIIVSYVTTLPTSGLAERFVWKLGNVGKEGRIIQDRSDYKLIMTSRSAYFIVGRNIYSIHLIYPKEKEDTEGKMGSIFSGFVQSFRVTP